MYSVSMEANSLTADRTERFADWEWIPLFLLLVAVGVLLLLEIAAGINIAARINISAARPSPKWLATLCAYLVAFLGPFGAFLGCNHSPPLPPQTGP